MKVCVAVLVHVCLAAMVCGFMCCVFGKLWWYVRVEVVVCAASVVVVLVRCNEPTFQALRRCSCESSGHRFTVYCQHTTFPCIGGTKITRICFVISFLFQFIIFLGGINFSF